jgi:hypothetical protein
MSSFDQSLAVPGVTDLAPPGIASVRGFDCGDNSRNEGSTAGVNVRPVKSSEQELVGKLSRQGIASVRIRRRARRVPLKSGMTREMSWVSAVAFSAF